MATSKVSINGTTIIDISDTTATASDVLASKKFYAADGSAVTGSIAAKTSSDLTVSGATVTAPAGFYSSSASKSVATTTLPTTTTTTQPTGTTLLTIDRSTSTRYLSIGAGYQTGGYYTISPVANGSVTAPSSISGSSATVTTGTNTLTLTKTVSVTPSVTTAGYISSGTAGNSSVSLTASVTTKGATTYNTSSSDQTIASGTYLTGTQTIKAVATAGISAANIKDGVTITVGDANDADRIAGVTGTFTDASTVSNGQTAATASQILSGYSAWVDANEVKGNIATMTLPTSAAASATSGYTSKATIGRSTSDQYINIPPGYNAAGGYYKVSAVANGSVTAPASISGSSATLSTGTNTITLTKTISVTPNVTTAGYISSGTAGNSSVSLTAAVTTVGAATYNTSASDQTISSGVYLTGAQTIRKVTTENISAENIKYGVTVKVGDEGDDDRIAGVTGTFTDSSTVSEGQTAASASQILSGYSAWVDGDELLGSVSTITMPTAADSSAVGTTLATFSRSTSVRYINIPAGFNAEAVNYKISAVSNMTLPTSTSSTASGTKKATISRSTSTQYLNIPTGYNGTKYYYQITATPDGVATAPSSISDTGASISTGTGTLTLTKVVSVTPDITTAGYISAGTAGDSTVSLTASVDIRSSTDLTASGATVTAPAGYYSSAASKSVATATLPTTTTTTKPSGTTLLTIDRNTSTRYLSIPAGYQTGGYYTISAVANGSVTAPSTITGTGATLTTGTGTLTLTKSVSVTPSVTTAGYISSGTAGNSNVSLTASVNIRSSSDLTASGATVTAPAGYYASSASKSVATATLPTTLTTTQPSGTTLLEISRSTSTRYLSIPAGYQTGGYYTINPVANGSATVSGGYIDIGTHGTLTVNNGSITISDSTTITPDVTAGYISAGTAGTFNMSLSAAVTTKGATTYHPSSTDQTIASGVYTTGTQTIKAVTTTNLSAGNIKSGVTVKIGDSTDDDCVTYVTGTYAGEAVVLQSKTVTPTESTQIITADTGYNALSSVEVEPISDMYVGSAVSRNTATDVIISSTQVDVPWGYYSERVVKNIPTTALPTATTTTQPSGTTILTIDRSTSTRYLSISAGYQTGGYYTISPVANGSVTAPSSISGSSATLSTGTGTLTLTKTVSVTPNVTTAGYISSGTAGNSSVSLTASVNIRSSSDLTASGATVTAPAGYYGSAASKSVTTTTLPTATTTTKPSGTTKLTIDRSTSTRYLSISEGYQTGGYYTISAVANGSVTAPSSISGTSATLSTGTGTLTLTKTVSVTPSVTTAGYISAGTAGDSSVSLTASVNIRSSSDLTASGATITAPAGYYSAAASKSVASGTAGTPTATKGSVSNHSISITPSVTNTTGYITGSTISGTAVSVSASELVSGTYSISANGTSIDVTNYKYVDVTVPSDATPMSDATILSICVI